MILFGVRGGMRTLAPGRRQVNLLSTRKREHSRKPDEIFDIIERCSPGPYLELFAPSPFGRGRGEGTAMAPATFIFRGGAGAMAVRITAPYSA